MEDQLLPLKDAWEKKECPNCPITQLRAFYSVLAVAQCGCDIWALPMLSPKERLNRVDFFPYVEPSLLPIHLCQALHQGSVPGPNQPKNSLPLSFPFLDHLSIYHLFLFPPNAICACSVSQTVVIDGSLPLSIKLIHG